MELVGRDLQNDLKLDESTTAAFSLELVGTNLQNDNDFTVCQRLLSETANKNWHQRLYQAETA